MRFQMCLSFAVAISLVPTAPAYAYDCDTDCGKEAKFKYPCPTLLDPGRKCTGKDPVKYAACEVAKAASCDLWEQAADFFEPILKEHLSGEFNAEAYEEAEDKNEYMLDCTNAAMAVLVAIGAEVGGPYGALAGGAAGLFISRRVCEQSYTW